jgi:protein O-mannosyl-transferase
VKKATAKKVPVQRPSAGKVQAKKSTVNKKSYFIPASLVLVVVLGIIIYSNSFKCSFHFDDSDNIVNNEAIRNLSDVRTWWSSDPARPIGIFSFALNYHFNKLDVWGYHFVNLIIHLINACLVFSLTLLIFATPAMKDQPISKQRKFIALFTALLFVSHPLATQSVTYIVQRLASMVTMFYLLSLALYIKARLTETTNKIKYVLYGGALLSAILAMLTKENAFTLPFAILLTEFFFLRTKKVSFDFKNYRFLLLIAGLTGFIILVASIFTFNIFKTIPPMQGHTYSLTSGTYLLTEFSVIAKYIQLLFLPINQTLDYDFPISGSFFEIRTMLSFAFLLSLLILAVFLFKKYRLISFGICWFFLALMIESSIVPIPNVIFEHRTYLPSFGFFLLLTTSIFLLFKGKLKPLAYTVLTIIIIANSLLAFSRNNVWKDDLTLWTDNTLKSPNSARSLLNRGVEYGKRQQWDKALQDYNTAIKLNPDFGPAYVNRGIAYNNLNIWDSVIPNYTHALRLGVDSVNSFYNRGLAYAHIGVMDKALTDFSSAIVLNPGYAKAYYNMGYVYGSLQQWDKALAAYTGAIDHDNAYSEAYLNRGYVFENLGQTDKAMSDYDKVLEIDPGNSMAKSNRALLLQKINAGKANVK